MRQKEVEQILNEFNYVLLRLTMAHLDKGVKDHKIEIKDIEVSERLKVMAALSVSIAKSYNKAELDEFTFMPVVESETFCRLMKNPNNKNLKEYIMLKSYENTKIFDFLLAYSGLTVNDLLKYAKRKDAFNWIKTEITLNIH